MLAGSLLDNPEDVVHGLVVALRCGLLPATKNLLPGLFDCSKGVTYGVRQQLEAWDRVADVKAPKQATTSTMPGLRIWSELQVRLQAGNMHADSNTASNLNVAYF